MLYHLFYPFFEQYSFFNLFRYITFRSFMAFLLATIVSILVGKRFIEFMKIRQFGQVIRDDGPKDHKKKAGTPTMGGIFIICSVLFVLILFGQFSSLPFLTTLFVMFSYFILGLADDYLKILKKNSKGVSAMGKLVWQFVTAMVASYVLMRHNNNNMDVYIPFLKNSYVSLGFLYPIFGSFVIVGSSNAVNLTDGLDGLAIGPIMTSAACLGVLAYLAGHYEYAHYLYIPYIDDVGELAVFASAIIGAGFGFLWYNTYPAQIFMGDVGSLSLGGVLGTMALATKNEILYVVIGGIFVLETVSVILQVASYKLRKKRIFLMAPIHHHFELKGWPEPKVIVRFWIISVVLAIVSLATIKIR